MARRKPTTLVDAIVLTSASSAEPQSIPGIPGLWSTSVPFVPADAGLSLDEARAALDEAGFEYEVVEVEVVEPDPEPAGDVVVEVEESGAGDGGGDDDGTGS